MIVHDSIATPAGPVHCSHSPAKANTGASRRLMKNGCFTFWPGMACDAPLPFIGPDPGGPAGPEGGRVPPRTGLREKRHRQREGDEPHGNQGEEKPPRRPMK